MREGKGRTLWEAMEDGEGGLKAGAVVCLASTQFAPLGLFSDGVSIFKLPRSAPGFIPVSLRKMTKGEGAMASDILGYKGKRVVVMGCFSGTGEACARALVDLGAEVHGADIKPSPEIGRAPRLNSSH